jgi:putative endonuclease
LVAEWYEARGYVIVARNWRSRQGEIDLIARKDRLIVVCEVKTRTTSTFGEPFEAVTRTKQMRIRRLAAEWLRTARPAGRCDLRFDVASVRGTEVDVMEEAF